MMQSLLTQNKWKVYIGSKVIDAAKILNVICTAFTGTSHLNKVYVVVYLILE